MPPPWAARACRVGTCLGLRPLLSENPWSTHQTAPADFAILMPLNKGILQHAQDGYFFSTSLKPPDKNLGVLKSGQAGANDEAMKTSRMGDVLIFYLGGKSRFSRSRKIAGVYPNGKKGPWGVITDRICPCEETAGEACRVAQPRAERSEGRRLSAAKEHE